MTEIHAFDPDGTPSPGAQIALDNALANASPEGAVAGLAGVTGLWAGTEAEYNALTPSSGVVYIITDGSRTEPTDPEDPGTPGNPAQSLGVPVTTGLGSVSAATSITPTLPTLPEGWWGYVVAVLSNGTSAEAWPAPSGWATLADNAAFSQWTTRHCGVFAAADGVGATSFAHPSGGSLRYVAVAVPVRYAPALKGTGYFGATAGTDQVSVPAATFSSEAVPLTLATTNYSGVSGASLPTMHGSTVEVGSGTAMSGTGSVTLAHVVVGSGAVNSTAAATYVLSVPMASGPAAYLVGIGRA